GQTCFLEGIRGHLLSDSDRMAVLDTCGVQQAIPRFPDAGRLSGVSAGGSYDALSASFGSALVTAQGGQYRICWCAAGSDCEREINFIVDSGELIIIGPTPLLQDRTCISGQTCYVQGLAGNFLSASYQVMIMDTCGVTTSLPGLPFDGRLQLGIGRTGGDLGFGMVRLTIQGGQYRLCWCADGQICSSPTQMTVDTGRLTVVGPTPLQQGWTCASGLPCNLEAFTGHGLSDGDKLVALDTCALALAPQRFPWMAQPINALATGATVSFGTNPVTGAGGRYRLCWCARGMSCSTFEDFLVDLGHLELVGPAPLEQHRTCVAGQTCDFRTFDGHSIGGELGPGGDVWILDTCGAVGHTIERLPDAGRIVGHSPRPADPTSVFAFGVTTLSAPGGLYRLCWCSSIVGPCTSRDDFKVNAGSFTMVGPSPLRQDRTCVSGRTCLLDGIIGHHLVESDKLLVLDTCSLHSSALDIPNSVIPMFQRQPVYDGSNTMAFQVIVNAVSVSGGFYRLCWCAAGQTCAIIDNFRVDLGRLTIIGPEILGQQHRTCVAGQACYLTGLRGEEFSQDDRVLVLDSCGAAVPPKRGGLLGASSTGSPWAQLQPRTASISFAAPHAAGNTAQGGLYRLCWCSGSGLGSSAAQRACGSPESFVTDMGGLTILGPAPLMQDRTCIVGMTCRFDGFTGVGFDNSDILLVLDTCGLLTSPVHHGIKYFETSTHQWTLSSSGASALYAGSISDASGGQYRLCWCAAGFACTSQDTQAHLAVDMGRLLVIGPKRLGAQHRTCVSGQECKLGRIEGSHFSSQDSFVLMDTCGHRQVLPRANNAGVLTDVAAQLPGGNGIAASFADISFSSLVLTKAGGIYRLCWCTHVTTCSVGEEFRADIGQVQIIGPAPLAQDRTCVTGQLCHLDGLLGVGFAGGDRFQVLDTCATFQTIPLMFTSAALDLQTGVGDKLTAVSWGVASVTSQGGQYRICWCAGGFHCSGVEDFRIDMGRLTLIGPESMPQGATCVAGQDCHMNRLTGHLLDPEDNVMLLDTCGISATQQQLRGFPHDGFATVTSSGARLSWDQSSSAMITLQGGKYRLCWCASLFTCSVAEHYRFDAGEFTLIGPSPLKQDRTCVTGQTCRFEDITGLRLHDFDAMLVMETCGKTEQDQILSVPYLPSGGKDRWPLLSAAPEAGSPWITATLSWGSTLVTAFGGQYRLCWCSGSPRGSASPTCDFWEAFRVDMGRLTIVGPDTFIHEGRTCISGQTCRIDHLDKHLDFPGDQLLVLGTCGQASSLVPRLPANGLMIVSAGGDDASFAAVVVTAPGGEYRICWCASSFACDTVEHFVTDFGQLTILGPRPLNQDRTCVSGQECFLDGLLASLHGVQLGHDDKWLLLDTCGRRTVVERMVKDGTVVSVGRSGTSLSFGTTPITVGGGRYRMCWCAEGRQCSIYEHFRVDAGQLYMIGPSGSNGSDFGEFVEQDRTCISGQLCAFSSPRGEGLTTSDQHFILETCGSANSTFVPRLPDYGQLSLQKSRAGTSHCVGGDCEVGFGPTLITAPGGQYRLCWCAVGQTCSLLEHFRMDVGRFTLLGPAPLQQHRTCVSGQSCMISDILGMLLAPQLFDTGLSTNISSDSLAILDTCGTKHVIGRAPQDFAISSSLSSGSAYSFSKRVTAAGGTYQLCWCSEVGLSRAQRGQRTGLSLQRLNSGHCQNGEEFVVTLGSLTLIGPSPQSQDRTCVSGQTCSFMGITGLHLQVGDRFLALQTCGSNSDIPGFSWSGKARPLSSFGTEVSWGTVANTAPGGTYRLCWCAGRDSTAATAAACGTPTDFVVDAGELLIIGPAQAAVGGYTATSSAQTYVPRRAIIVSETLRLQERPPLGPEASAGQHRECVAGQPCEIPGLHGLHLSAGDAFAIMDTCGKGTAVVNRLPFAGRPEAVVSEAEILAWNLPQSRRHARLQVVALNFTTPLTATGGQYRICWCAEVFDCTTSEQMRVDVGQLELHGPSLHQKRTCVNSQDCFVERILGRRLHAEDQLMIMDTCGVAPSNSSRAIGFPEAGLATTKSLNGVITDHSGYAVSVVSAAINEKFDFSGLRITAGGGTFRMCWCAGGFNCTSGPQHFLQDLGELRLQGPSPLQQDRTCMTGQNCRLRAIGGPGLSADDVVMVLDTCGPSPGADVLLPHITNPEDGISNLNTVTGQTFTWMGNGTGLRALVTSAGGMYRLCWCRPAGFSITCKHPEEFQTDLGQLMLLGPAPLGMARTCVSGQTCVVANMTGLHLSYGDSMRVLSTCGAGGSELPRMPRDGISLPGLNDGKLFSWGPERITTAGGQFRLCWCASGYSCALQAQYQVDAGELIIIGPAPHSQEVVCASGFACWGWIAGKYLASNDRVMVADECGAPMEAWPQARDRYPEVPGFPDRGIATLSPYVNEAFQFSWGSIDPITAAGGVYKLCWCASGLESGGCSASESFRTEAGSMVLSGPSEYLADFFLPVVPGPQPAKEMWRQDLPDPSIVKVSEYGGALSIYCSANTAQSATRGNMPILYVDAPSSGLWEARVLVRVSLDAQDVGAGLTVYDKDGQQPDLLFGLDRWSARGYGQDGAVLALRYSTSGLSGAVVAQGLASLGGNVSWLALKIEKTGSGRYSLWYNHRPPGSWLAPDDVSDSSPSTRQRVFAKTAGEPEDRLFPETEWQLLASEVTTNVEGRRLGIFAMTSASGGTVKFKDFLVRDRFPQSVASFSMDDDFIREGFDKRLPTGTPVAGASPAKGSDGYSLGALLFDGSSRRLSGVGLNRSAALPYDPLQDDDGEPLTDFTIAVWIKPYSLASSGIFGRKLGNLTSSTSVSLSAPGGVTWSMQDSAGQMYNESFETPTTLPYAAIGPTSAKTSLTRVLEANEWTHLTFVKQGETLRLFRNAEPWSFSRYMPGKSMGGSHQLLLNFLPEYPFHGALDDLRFFDVALAHFTIAHLYGNAGKDTPRAKTQRCVAGVPCSLHGLAGERLSNVARLAVMAHCGRLPVIAGFPGGAISDLTTGRGQVMHWGNASGLSITAPGGKYQLCWCGTANPAGCGTAADFRVVVGALVVVGPYARQERTPSCTCSAGQIAAFDLTGVELSTGDSMQILSTCGVGALGVAGLPGSAKSTLSKSACFGHTGLGVARAGALEAHGSGLAGKTQSECCALCERSLYSDCKVWAHRPSDMTCFLYRTVVSLERQQDRVTGIRTEYKTAPDKVIIATTLTTNRLEARSVGPFRLYSCRSKEDCFFDFPLLLSAVKPGYQSFNVTVNYWPGTWDWNGIKVFSDSSDRWFLESLLVTANGISWNFTYVGWLEQGAQIYLGKDPVPQISFGGGWASEAASKTSGGRYRLCWCAEGKACTDTSDFKTDAGGLTVAGPAPLVQHRTCVTGQACVVADIGGSSLANGDKLMILKTCGQTGLLPSGMVWDGISTTHHSLVPRFSPSCRSTLNCPRDQPCDDEAHSKNEQPWISCGISDVATGQGSEFHWGAGGNGEPSAPGGVYKMCWCSNGQTCSMFEHFKVELGELTLVGPNSLEQHRTCVTGQACVVSGIQGQHLKEGDKLMVLDVCGQKPHTPMCPSHPSEFAAESMQPGWNSTLAAQGCGTVSDRWPGSTIRTGQAPGISEPAVASAHPCGSSMLWVPFPPTESCFSVFDSILSWADAESACSVIYGGHLASISSKAENDFLVEWVLASGQTYWIGLNDVANEGTWEYTDGANSSWKNWADLQPELTLSNIEDCGVITGSDGAGQWRDESCTVVRKYMCKRGGDFSGITIEPGDEFRFGGFRKSQEQLVPPSSAGGLYRMCWCPYGFRCSQAEDFRMDIGTITLQGPAPLNQHKTCVSGQPCLIQPIYGLELQDNDLVHILDTCGQYVDTTSATHSGALIPTDSGLHLPRFPSNGGTQSLSEGATEGGSKVSWGPITITALGGRYRLCWCAAGFSCSVVPEFRVDFGLFDLIGPAPLNQKATCTSGQSCSFNITGFSLSDGDKLMVLDTCGRAGLAVNTVPRFVGDVDGLPGDPRGISNRATNGGSSYQWGGDDKIVVSASGGLYRLCWAANGFPQELPEHFGVDLGFLQLLGPDTFSYSRTCISGQLCHWGGITGYGLDNGDRIMVLDQCGRFKGKNLGYGHDEDIIQRFPWSGKSFPASSKGSVFSWGEVADAAYVTSAGGSYRLCWADRTWGLGGPGSFRLDTGTFFLAGPAPMSQKKTCVSGQVCKWSGLQGTFLSDGDAIIALDTCGMDTAMLPRWSNPDAPRALAISQPATGTGTTFSWGHIEVSTPGGMYRLCWCSNPQPPDMNCSHPSDFRVDAGTLHIVGPWPGFQGRTCVSGQPCGFTNFTGMHLQSGDRLMVLDTCANHHFSGSTAVVKRFSGDALGLSLPATGAGHTFDWQVFKGFSSTSAGGIYRLCWCASGFDCNLPKQFQVDAGHLTVIGPIPHAQDRTCVSGQVCNVDGIAGQDLGNGDKFMILDTCGVFAVPPRFSGSPSGMSDSMEVAGTLAKWGGSEVCAEPYNFDCLGYRPTSRGGDYRLCWCANGYTCNQPGDFRVDAGMLTMIGPNPLTNKRTCVSGQPCKWDGIEGHFTQSGDKFIMLDTCAHPEPRQTTQVSDKFGIYNQVHIGISQYGFFDGYSNPSMNNGSSYSWGDGSSVITVPGGLYRLCWCGANYNCTLPEHFQTDAGVQDVVGPFLELPDPSGTLTVEQRLQLFRCTANQPCSFTGLQGRYLSHGDQVMIKTDCRPDWEYNTTIADWPSGTFVWGISDPGKVTASVDGITYQDYDWAKAATTSNREVRAEGAYYRLCWCARGYNCVAPKDFSVDAGTMMLVGPHHNQHKTCVAGALCIASQITGVGLSNGDRTMVLRYCDTDLYIARYPNQGYSDPAFDNGSAVTWDSGKVVPVTSPGGYYKLCWCAATQTCTKSGSNFRVDYGTLYIVGPAPLTQSRTCLSGEFCNVTDFTGFGLFSGDKLMISSKCGDPNGVIPRFPQGGISERATESGSQFAWGSYVTAGGGIYWMCWCSNMVGCDRADHFTVETGLLAFPGPYLGIERTCRSGMECGLSNVKGVGLQNGDKVMVMNQCGTNAVLQGWPDGGISDTAIFQGTEYSWGIASGGLQVTGAGGEYSLCWCSASAPNCTSGLHFRTEMGIVRVTGPALGQKKDCTAGQSCAIQQFGGYELQNGDRIMISDSCLPSLSAFVPGFGDNGIFIGTNGGSFFSQKATLTASGGVYSLCWCPLGSPCQSPENFQVNAGNLTVIGPYLDQQKTCLSSQVCHFDDYLGQSLKTTDRVMLLDTCGTKFKLARLPNDALSTIHDNFGSSVSWGPVRATSAGGTYRMCWCASSSTCSSPKDFIVDSGTLHHRGPKLYQLQECYPGVTCTFDNFLGYGLQAGELLMALSECGTGKGISGFPNAGISYPATKDGMQFEWGDASLQALSTTTRGGFYRLCWCPGGHGLDACASSFDFRVDAGALIVKGPRRQVDVLCGAGQVCTLGPWEGAKLSLDDRVAVLRSTDTCGDDEADILIAGGEYKDVTCNLDLTACEASLNGMETMHGGMFKVCYCVSYLDPNGVDTDVCTEKSEFTSFAATLQVRGPLGTQGFPCVVGINCDIAINGFMLTTQDKIKLVRSGDPCNGFPVTGVPAQEILIDAGQSQRTNTIAARPVANDSWSFFELGGIRSSGDYKICYCSSVLSCLNPYDYGGDAGNVQVAGADSSKVYICRRGSACAIYLQGWRQGPNDRLKIISEGGTCGTDQPTFGFGSNPAWVDAKTTTFLDNTNTSSINKFTLGVAIVGTQEDGCTVTDVKCGYTLCYCPGINGCTSDADYTHTAGALRVTESIRGITADASFPMNSFALGLLVDSAYAGGTIRCVAKAGTAIEWGLYADSSFFTNGPDANDIGWGSTSGEAIAGPNKVALHLQAFVAARQIIRTWCYLSDAPAYVYPPHLEGVEVAAPQGMRVPRAIFHPAEGWNGALFGMDVMDLLVAAGRRLATQDSLEETEIDEPNSGPGFETESWNSSEQRRLANVADVRVMTAMSTEGCRGLAYHMDERIVRTEQTKDALGNLQLTSSSLAVLDTTMCMDDPSCAMMVCFFGGPQEYPIEMKERFIIRPKPALVTKTLYRGSRNRITLTKPSNSTGNLSWISLAEVKSQGLTPGIDQICPNLNTAEEQGRVVGVSPQGVSEEILMDEPVGTYYVCLLDNMNDAKGGAPFNSAGSLEIKDVVNSIKPSRFPSSRTTLKLDVAALLPGTVTCVVKEPEVAATRYAEIMASVLSAASTGSSAGAKAQALALRAATHAFLLSEDGTLSQMKVIVPQAVPPNVTVVLVMAKYTDSITVPAWCWHSATEELMILFPSDLAGEYFDLPGDAPAAYTLPGFIWPGAAFVVWVENVADSSQSRVQLVNTSAECGLSLYSQAISVVQKVEGKEQTIKAYLLADMSKRLVCFFELSSSLPLVIETSTGETLGFSQAIQPSFSMIVEGVINQYVHRGLPTNLVLSGMAATESGEVFLLPDSVYYGNGGYCLPPQKTIGTPQTTTAYVQRFAAVQIKPVPVLPSPINGATHFVTLSEVDTVQLIIGLSYSLCYVGYSTDSTRVFNKIGKSLPVRDIIVALMQDPIMADAASSKGLNLRLQASLTGTVSCLATIKPLDRPPQAEEIRGDYVTTLPQDFVPAFQETDVLGRALAVEVNNANSNTTVLIKNDPAVAANIRRMPLGVAPQVYTWCQHSLSSVIFPEDGDGIAISLSVLTPPIFQYSSAGKTYPQVIIARNVTFPSFTPAWSEPGFPIYYYDEVAFTITPTLPQGIDMSAQNGDIKGDPLPGQLTPAGSYQIQASSKFDVQKSGGVNIVLSVTEPGQCSVSSVMSTEVLMGCMLQDAHNLDVQGLYLLISPTSADPLPYEQSSFACYGDAAQTDTSGTTVPEFTCSRQDSRCCCWLWVGFTGDATTRNLTDARSRSGKVLNSVCGFSQYQRYEVMTMAAGVNPMQDNGPAAVVWDGVFDFTVPEKKEAKPIAFEMQAAINYEETCDPVRNGAAAEQKCKDMMKEELSQLLAAPSDMITITGLRPR
ncbi:unnamed protein product, partial [Polarella glacialis]